VLVVTQTLIAKSTIPRLLALRLLVLAPPTLIMVAALQAVPVLFLVFGKASV
jgi:hypothetical protein